MSCSNLVQRIGRHVAMNVPISLGRSDSIGFGNATPHFSDHVFDCGEGFLSKSQKSGLSGVGYWLSTLVDPDDSIAWH